MLSGANDQAARTTARGRLCVVVNVDDVGLHPAVQRAVEAAAEMGVVTSASVLANGPCVDAARNLRGIGLAAHLNILRGRPLSPRADVRSLVGPDGLFVGRYVTLLRRYVLGGVDLAEVEREWDRQIQSLLALGLRLTHLDSEKHIHCWPRLMPIACRLAKKYGLSWVRRTREPSPLLRWDMGGVRTKLLNCWAARHRPVDGVDWPDSVWGVADTAERLTAERFRKSVLCNPLVRPSGTRVLEIVCHPGKRLETDGPLPASFGRLRVEQLWGAEFESLLSSDWPAVFREQGIDLVHYGQIDQETDRSGGAGSSRLKRNEAR